MAAQHFHGMEGLRALADDIADVLAAKSGICGGRCSGGIIVQQLSRLQ